MEKQPRLDYLTNKKDKLNNELIETAIQIADLGKKLYEQKEELRITNILLEKWKKSANTSTQSEKQ